MGQNELQLKPCPFCGKNPEFKFLSKGTRDSAINVFYRYFRIWCPNCGCTHNHDVLVELDYSPHTGLRVDETQLRKEVENWNRRADHGTE